MAADKAALKRERDQARKRFVINAVLLSLIDPVRGEPTKDVLEQYPNDDILRSHQLKEKFLDSFALICSTSRSGKETASAVCMEQNHSPGTVLRVARNYGISQQDLSKLKMVLQILVAVANGEELSMQAETEVLGEIVDLDRDRILSLVQKLEKGGIQRLFQSAIARLSSGDGKGELLEEPGFKRWICQCPFTTESLSSSGTSRLFSLIRWAAQARWAYHKHLQILLAIDPTSVPPWMETLHKLARYWAATKSMVKFAVKQPEVFTGIHIKVIPAPAQQQFSLSQERAPLQKAVGGLVKNDWKAVMRRLAQRWEPDDAEVKFRRACRLTLTLHVEMQLLEFYERNPELVPHLRLMGTSKKACYLCHEFLLQHPLRIRVLACHQKIYPSWMPPSCGEIPGVARNELFWSFSKRIEQVVVKELRTRLAAPRRPKNKDSTAGPSLTVTATIPTEVWARHMAGHHLSFEGDDIPSQGY